MTQSELNSLFSERIACIDFDEQEELISFEHKFLKMAVFETLGSLDIEVGNFEFPKRKIKIV